VHKTTVDGGCKIALGRDAVELGFVPGTPVQVIKTRAGSLIVAIDLDLPIEVQTFKPLYGGAAQKAMREAKRALSE
jgi:hypothetical protein